MVMTSSIGFVFLGLKKSKWLWTLRVQDSQIGQLQPPMETDLQNKTETCAKAAVFVGDAEFCPGVPNPTVYSWLLPFVSTVLTGMWHPCGRALPRSSDK